MSDERKSAKAASELSVSGGYLDPLTKLPVIGDGAQHRWWQPQIGVRRPPEPDRSTISSPSVVSVRGVHTRGPPVESAQQGERASILDAAVPPWEPSSSPVKVVAILLVGTFGLAGGLAVLLELVDSVIVGESDIERVYRMPVLGAVSKMS